LQGIQSTSNGSIAEILFSIKSLQSFVDKICKLVYFTLFFCLDFVSFMAIYKSIASV
jgi:hypothetical protein